MDNKTDDSLPLVSCLCITFARPSLLEEAIQSFLNQDYQGEKELIILNDFYLQELSFEHPDVTVVNLPRKVNTLGEKRNMVAALAKGEVLFPWDDDDISLPFRLSQSVKHLQQNGDKYYKPKSAFVWNEGFISSIEQNGFHAQCCYTRDLFTQTFYSGMGSGEDQDFDAKVQRILDKEIDTTISAQENFYLYRWGGTNSYHISVMSSESELLQQSIRSAERNEIPIGLIKLLPKWNIDYHNQAREFISPN